jgi:hypothetical protein
MTYDIEKLKSKLAVLNENRLQREKNLQDLEAQKQNESANLLALRGAILLIEEMLKEIEPPASTE